MVEDAKSGEHQVLEAPPATLGVPMIYGASFTVSWTSNDCSLVISRYVPTGLPAADSDGQISIIQPQAVVHMSIQAAKDLSLVLADGIARYEADWGEVETDFTRSRK